MRCISKKAVLALCLFLSVLITGCSKEVLKTEVYEQEQYNRSLYRGTLSAAGLCVTDTDVALEGYSADPSLHAAGLFDIKDKKVLYASKIHERLFPASTTKIMTAYVTLKYGNLEDTVTVGPNATQFAEDEQTCGLQTGDTVSLYDLLCGLLLYSGNDCAVAIAEHVAGSVEAFADMMNAEAVSLRATNTHFVNPHGLQDDNHYTTAYDLYLIFNACIKDQRFMDIISKESYTGTLTSSDGSVRSEVWEATNFYSQDLIPDPEGVQVIGGKTGTTDEAGSCVILYSKDSQSDPYISIIMGAGTKDLLYGQMSAMLSAGERPAAAAEAVD
ncbi:MULTISPECIES: D-alanyl-D-alanine carboxypeptidase family protein [Clostridia]|uniref:D-alanyl-D-alanine carboxypeptidase family protein n=1 Tax=Clostridia TaxID=186801 RepID=UPI00067F19A0|nr:MULTISPECIES: D-alanyl-D-alanine carboxypeptidase [Clostridia]